MLKLVSLIWFSRCSPSLGLLFWLQHAISRDEVNTKDSMTFQDGIMPFVAKFFISKMCAASSRCDSLMPICFPCCSGWPERHYWEHTLCRAHFFSSLLCIEISAFSRLKALDEIKDCCWANQSICGEGKGVDDFLTPELFFSLPSSLLKYRSMLLAYCFALFSSVCLYSFSQ